jgi:flagellar motor component MotA
MDSQKSSSPEDVQWENFPYAPIKIRDEAQASSRSSLLMDPVLSIQYRLEGFYTLEELESLVKDPFIDQAVRLLIDNRCFNLTQISTSVLDSPSADREEFQKKFLSGGDGGLSPPLSHSEVK